MAQINTGRVILGGLAAGLVINISEAVLNLVVLGAENEALSASLGVDPVGGGGIAVYTIFAFLIGIVAIWLYAAMRPRLGAGPGAATGEAPGLGPPPQDAANAPTACRKWHRSVKKPELRLGA